MKQLTHAENCNNLEIRRNTKEFVERFPIDGDKDVRLTHWREKKHSKGENPNKKNNFKTL